MRQYKELLKTILTKGTGKSDRTGTGTLSIFGPQMTFNLEEGFPLITTKKVFFKGVVHELLWFLSGDTNIKYLVDNGVNIWNAWPYKIFKQSTEYNGETPKEFAAKIMSDKDFADKHGNLGHVYGKQWRDFNGVDQIKNLVRDLKYDAASRRLIISAWNPAEQDQMALPPCHCFVQFYVVENKLSCHLYQRSADMFLGVPFDIASYALLTMMLAQVSGLKPDKLICTFGDAHIYINHISQCSLQLSRDPRSLPRVELNPEIKDIFDFKYDDIRLIDYNPHPAIQAPIAV